MKTRGSEEQVACGFHSPRTDGKRVLLVRSRWIQADTMRSVLEEVPGWTVTVVSHGEQAFELLRGGVYDLVITDIAMISDQYSGFRLIRSLRYDLDLTVPIMVVTNLPSSEIKEAACSLGASDYITFPFRMTDLKQRALRLVAAREVARG